MDILRSCAVDLAKNIEQNSYDGRENELERDLQRVKDDYNRKAKGNGKG